MIFMPGSGTTNVQLVCVDKDKMVLTDWDSKLLELASSRHMTIGCSTGLL